MALQIFIAHSGQRLQTDSGSFPSLDDFKAWVAKNTTVAAQDHISLTAQGKTVRVQDLQTENQIYIYDRRIVQSSSASSPKTLISEISIPSKYNVAKPPDTIADQNDLQAWKDLFMARRSWAYNVLDDCVSMSETTQKRYEEIQIITKCLDTALHNLGKHVRGVDVRNSEVQEWTKGVQEEQAVYGTDWEASLGQLRALPASTQFLKFITGRSFRKSRAPSLEDLIDIEQVKKAGKLTQNLSSQLGRNSSDLGARVDDVFEKADNLQKGVDEVIAHPALKSSDSLQLMQDIEPIAKKIGNDCESILGYSNTSKNLSQASRTALLHTRKFLPDLSQRSIEMDGLLRSATKLRNSIAARSLELMQDIARLTTMLSDLNARFAKFELDSDSFEAINLLSFVHKLPITYASFISESIRRREWSEKVQADSSTLANEMAIFQDEEAKRRKKWQKNTGAELWGDRADSTIMTLQVNLQGEDEQWPQATRQELVDYLAILRNQGANAEVVKHVSKIVADLSNPTKQQSKRTKAFKAGSIHEAALGRSALLVRGDDDLIRVLQEEKSRTEGKLKTAESRVRRLEDLVHRQSHVSRISTGNIFQTNSPSPEAQAMANPMASPRLNDDASRRSSVSSRRFSSNQGTEEKTLQQKLLGIEAELIAERERVSGMEKEISAKNTAAGEMKTQVDEANSTKKDLMENFEAQQREFLEERRSLEAEIKRLKAKLEELEDEMEGAIGSREHVDDRVRLLQDDFEKLRKENAEEAQKAQGQISFLRQEGKLQREANEALQQQLEAMKEENRELLARAERAESAEDEQLKTLEKLHVQLSPNSPIPNDVSSVTDALASMVGDIVAGLESHKRDLAIAKADKDDAESTIAVIKSDIAELTEKLATEEKESTQLRESLDAEQAKFAALEEELSDERLQLSSLRTKIADGETGSEAIRNRLEEEERKVTSLSEDLAAKLSRIGSLEEELRMYQEKSDATRSKFSKLTARFESRTSRAKDLTQRIYSQNDRLCILLEQLSYSVTRAGGSMSIQRIPRPERSSQQNNDSSDPGTSLKRSITSTALTRKALTESADLDLLYWMHNDDSEAESDKYDAFTQAIDSFDVELFSTTIVRRFKDFEHTLKKAVKDMRAYRDKSHSAQKEAHGKIAFKNFKEGDLALFLPTRNQATGAWAAFNVGAPHYFLREQDAHKLQSRDWLLARIHKIEDRVVDLSKSMSSTQNRISDRRSFGETSNGGDSFEDDNPFELSDGLRWYLLEAHEEKPGAPATPGLGKSTVTSTPINASATIHRSKKSVSGGVEGINKTLNKSLESRRSSNNSKQSLLATSKPVQPASGSASLKSIPAGQSKDGPSDTQAIISASRPDANGGDRGKNPENTTNSTAAGTSPSKKSMIFESLWSLDLSLESGKNKK